MKPIALTALLALTLAGCGQGMDRVATPATTAAVPASAPAAADPAAQARTVAARLNARADVLAESGLQLRSAVAEGQLVTAEFGLSFPGADLSEEDRAEVGPTFTNALLEGFCADDNARTFFASGNRLRVRFLGSDDALVGDVTVDSCA
ncbi:hypothetical protein [Histidinibacterium aquaticum]|uniref:Uncharacterized protein n=1 Tax=Histidinibacterium aquaticum TaxID=2613962 RepID=A0A5J5GR72_9RHOB|nr:hypothetical protein [Histidinibacterium aquaticum]KAA9010253.1 hypothetical protein F3S47_03105 [Histidinibacterium aquaticum]